MADPNPVSCCPLKQGNKCYDLESQGATDGLYDGLSSSANPGGHPDEIGADGQALSPQAMSQLPLGTVNPSRGPTGELITGHTLAPLEDRKRKQVQDTESPKRLPPKLRLIESSEPAEWRDPDLIRNSPIPNKDDFSDHAQMIRLAQSPKGVITNFTWTQHYDILTKALRAAVINELNGKLIKGLKHTALLRNINPALVHPALAVYVEFARKGLQAEINWMWCWEHLDILNGLDLGKPGMSLEELDRLLKSTGVWAKPSKEEEAKRIAIYRRIGTTQSERR